MSLHNLVDEFWAEWRAEVVALADSDDIRDYIRRIAIEGARLMQARCRSQDYGTPLGSGMTQLPTREEVMARIDAIKPEDM